MMDWIDELLGRITMYRLVLYCLITLDLFAALLMFVGDLGFSLPAFLISITIFVGVSYASNRLFGWLFGVQPHSESALITGMILSLLFLPPLTVITGIEYALVAVIAMASKYVIALRNRHLFNPAAIATVIASIGGLAYAGWWVATPAMLPVTIVVSTLILYRTKKLRVGLIFIVVALVLLVAQKNSPVDVLTSWPIIFLAGVMLSEPLTLPPRAREQYAVAALVGLLMTLPLHYGRITMTPALALVVGNFIGWWFGQRQAIKLRFVGKKQMGRSIYEFTFDTKRPHFIPGQYIEMTLIHKKADSRGHRRIFSIASKPGEEQLSIGTRMPEKPSSFKKALMNLKPGAVVYATRISGDFVLPVDTKAPVVCIAGGIGITPYISFIQSADRPVQLIYSLSDSADMSYVDTLRQHNVDVTVVAPSAAKLPDPDWKFAEGHITKELLTDLIDVNQQPVVYISGPPGMVLAIRKIVKELGVKHIKVDEFSGY